MSLKNKIKPITSKININIPHVKIFLNFYNLKSLVLKKNIIPTLNTKSYISITVSKQSKTLNPLKCKNISKMSTFENPSTTYFEYL